MLISNIILLCTLCQPNEDSTDQENVFRRLSASLTSQPAIMSEVHNKIVKKFDIRIPKKYRLKLDGSLFFHNTLVIFKTILQNLSESVDKFHIIDGIREYATEIETIFAELVDKIYDDFFISPDMDLIRESRKLLEVQRKTRIEFSKDNLVDFCLKYFIYSTLVGENVCQRLDKFMYFFDDIDTRDSAEVSKKDYRLVYGNIIVDSYDNMNVTFATMMGLIYNYIKKDK